MLRLALICLLVGCPSKPPEKPKSSDDTAVRIRVAYAEARRGGGIAELVDLATHGKKSERQLALRGLGRIGGAKALAALRTALTDPDTEIVASAAAAIGLMASLDEEDLKITGDLLNAFAAHPHEAILEALGRAGDATAQHAIAMELLTPMAEVAAIALGRHGRRKIELSAEARIGLIAATGNTLGAVRYAATWALARETIKPDDPQIANANEALTKRIHDPGPEIRAQAIAALARRKQVAAAQVDITQALSDADWRVRVEAVRALTDKLLGASPRNNDPHVADEIRIAMLKSLPLAEAATATVPHVRLEQQAAWVKAKGGTLAERRAVVATLLTDNDVRVRAAAVGVLPSMWEAGDAKDHESAIKTIAAAIADKNPILAGSAVDAADELLDTLKHDATLDAALVSRAESEKDLELEASLLGVITKHQIPTGITACQKAKGHPVVEKAAFDCLDKLGSPVTRPIDPLDAKPPFVDVTAVIGKKITWRIKTTRGDIAIALLPDVAPWAVATIVTLTKRGFYDGLEFHRVVGNFVVQGGDPTESGWGGPGFVIPAEPGSILDGSGFVAGGVGIADAGRDSGGSQWFIMHSRATHLDGRYTWIGSVVEGLKFADELMIGDEVLKASVEIADR